MNAPLASQADAALVVAMAERRAAASLYQFEKEHYGREAHPADAWAARESWMKIDEGESATNQGSMLL